MAHNTLETYCDKLDARLDLNEEEVAEVADSLSSAEEGDALKARFLCALSDKGESVAEVKALAAFFRGQAVLTGLEEDWSGRAIDIVGTGGDGVGSFNISTVTAFIVAAAGVPVIKHGNRSITSKSGSADMLAAVGVPLETDEATRIRSMEKLNFCFLFAPVFHPAFKHIAPVRKQLAAEGKRTVFNILGPLINPAKPAYQLMGVYDQRWIKPLADALHGLGQRCGWVVHGCLQDGRGLDELSCVGLNKMQGFGQRHGEYHEQTAEDVGLSTCPLDDILGGDAECNLALLHDLMNGRAPLGLYQTLQWNAGMALWTAGYCQERNEGIAEAGAIIKDGRLARWLKQVETFYRG